MVCSLRCFVWFVAWLLSMFWLVGSLAGWFVCFGWLVSLVDLFGWFSCFGCAFFVVWWLVWLFCLGGWLVALVVFVGWLLVWLF